MNEFLKNRNLRNKYNKTMQCIYIGLLLGDYNMIMKNYVADELANKVWQLHKALNQAEKIVSVLEEENQKLKNLLCASENTSMKKDMNKIQRVA